MLIDEIKLEDVVKKDNVSQDNSEGTADTTKENSEGADGAEGDEAAKLAAEEAAKAAADSGTEVESESIAFDTLTQETGVEVRSNQDLTERLKELADYKSGKADMGLSPALKKAMEIEKAGGNITDFFRAFTLNEAQMTDKDVLRHIHLQTDKLAQKNPNLAGMTFDRQYNAEFAELLKWQSISDDLDKQAYYKEHAENIEFQKELHAHKVNEGREGIKAQKDNYPVTVPAQGPSKEEQDAIIEKHNKAVEATLTGFKVIDIPIDEKENFAIGLNTKTKPLVEGWMRNMPQFLAHIGIDQKGFNYEKLMRAMVLVAEIDNGGFGSRFKKQIIDNADARTLENDLNGNRIIDRTDKNGAGGLTEEQEFLQKAQAAKEAKRRG
jgi:hypothetical protein